MKVECLKCRSVADNMPGIPSVCWTYGCDSEHFAQHVAPGIKESRTLVNTGDKKADNGKPRMSLVPQECLDGLIGVLEFGAKKYEPDNWKKQDDYRLAEQRYYDSIQRHLAAMRRGETHDPESGLLHADHVLCNATFLAYFARK